MSFSFHPILYFLKHLPRLFPSSNTPKIKTASQASPRRRQVFRFSVFPVGAMKYNTSKIIT